jgi:diguanylate cyclase (GGDEF)-like protein
MYEVIKDIRNICGASYCAILTMNEMSRSCSLLCEDISDEFRKTNYKDGWLTDDFYDIALSWENVIGGSNCIILKDEQDMETLKSKNLVWYNSLKDANVESIVLFPLKNGMELLGYIWANNFDTERTAHIKETLELTTFFLASEISSYQMFDKFRILSTVDLLTGVLNRNEMNNRVMQLSADTRPGRKNVGIIFADLNGLKTMNDNHGHSAGDKLIRDAAKILKEVFPNEEIYRAGGDEFMVLLRDTSIPKLEASATIMKEKAAETDTVSFAIGISLEEDSTHIYDAMKAADVNMYENKKKFYEENPELKRR